MGVEVGRSDLQLTLGQIGGRPHRARAQPPGVAAEFVAGGAAAHGRSDEVDGEQPGLFDHVGRTSRA